LTIHDWNYIYNTLDPVAFAILGISVHWYGIMYVLALLVSMGVAIYIVKKDNLPFPQAILDSYFIWAEIGVILGARIGYILVYDPDVLYYLTHPWQMFNPFANGSFVGIRGMSYHGAFLGFFLASYLFSRYKKRNFMQMLDLVVVSIPLGYIFGRIGNFLNQELVGKETDLPIGIYVAGILRHPSQLYEAFLEGVVMAIFMFWYRKKATFAGELAAFYGIGYSIARFSAEFFREPDSQLGYLALGMSMGQILSVFMAAVCLGLYFYWKKCATKTLWQEA